MASLLNRRVMSELWARRVSWTVGFAGLAVCTTLILKMLPEFGIAASIGLIAAVALAWVVIGSQLPRAVRA